MTTRPSSDRPWPPLAHPHNAGEPEKAFNSGFTVLDAFVVLILGFASQVLVGVGAGLAGVDFDVSARAVVVVTVLSQVVGLALIVGWLRVRGHALWPVLGPVRPRWTHVAMGVGLGVTGVVLVLLVGAVVTSLLPDAPPPEQALVEIFGQDLLASIGVVVAAVVLAPIVEEISYRAVLFQSIRSRIGLWGAMVLSALVFAAVHFEVFNAPAAMIGLVSLALWLAAMFHQTGSLVVSIVAHGTYNAVMLGMALLFQQTQLPA